MNYEKEIRKLLDIAKTHGLNQREVSERLGKRAQYITEGLSKGGNEDMYTRIKMLIDKLDIEKSNIASGPMAEYKVPVSEYISELKRTNNILQESIQLSLNSLLSGQGDLREVLAKHAGRTDQRLDDMSEELHSLSEVFRQFQGMGKPVSGSNLGKENS